MLLIEDNEYGMLAMATVLIEQLKLHPTLVIQSKYSLEALEKFKKDLQKSCNCDINIRLIIINIDIPIINGFELTTKILNLIKEDSRGGGQNCKIVGVSST